MKNAMTYEKTPVKPKIRTKTTKEIETKAFDSLPSWLIISKLYKRHELTILYITLTLLFA